MCLAVPVKILELLPGGMARIDAGGLHKEVNVSLLEEVAVGDWILLHVGFALTKLSAEEAERTLALFSELDLNADEAEPLPS